MQYKIYEIYDSGIERYLQPFYARAKGEAIRSIQELVNDPSHQFCKHAEHYTLFEVGEFDDETGSIQMYTAKECVANFIALKKIEVQA